MIPQFGHYGLGLALGLVQAGIPIIGARLSDSVVMRNARK
jgi:hypothetical protein